MKNFFSFSKKEYFINFILFSLITVVFLNHIHNSINPYQKTPLKFENKETYVVIEKTQLKKKFSEELILNSSYDLFFDRNCKVTGDFHDRHKVRWVKAFFLKSIFENAYNIKNELPYYLNILLHSLLIFLSLIIINKTLKIDKKYNLFFLIYVIFIFQQYLSEYSYSIFELFFFSLALYSSKNKKHWLFLLSCVLAILNRESGFIILLSWLLFNQNEFKKFVLFSLISGVIFFFINFDIVKCLFDPKFFIPLENQKGQVNITDFKNMSFFSLGKLIFVNFLLPFGIGFYYLFLTKIKNKILTLLLLIYLVIFIVATPAHHISVRLILLPLIMTSIFFYNDELKKNTKTY
jgi:hypothetical protein